MKKLLILSAVLYLSACNNNNKPEIPEDDEPEEIIEKNETTILNKAKEDFSELFTFYHSKDSSFTADRFSEPSLDTLPPLAPHPLEEESIKPYYPYLIYNADSSKAIDLYSYNIMLSDRNGKITGEAGGPDTEIGLVDLRNKTRQRLLFVGPSSTIHDASWIGDSSVAIAGGEILEDGKFKPAVWVISLNRNTMQYLDYPEGIKMKPADYKDKRINIR
jgi:hypothetical protein